MPSYVSDFTGAQIDAAVSAASTAMSAGGIVNGNGLTNALSTYLTISNANTTYLTIADASSDYLTKVSASSTYLTQASALSTYLSIQDASDTYLSKTSASSTYLSKTDAGNTYLSIADAATTYLTQSDASDTYLSKSDASSTYLSQSDASDTYLTQSDASTTYEPILTAGNSTQFYRGDKTWNNTLTGRLYLTTVAQEENDHTGQLSIESGSTILNGGYFSTIAVMAPNVGNSQNLFLIGTAKNAKNSAYFGFHYSGTSGSNDNYLTMGIYGVDKIMNITGAGYVLIGDTLQFSNTTSWKKGSTIIGANGSDKIVIGYLNASTNGATIGSHASSCTAWAPLNVSGSLINFRMSETLVGKFLDGCLSLFPAAGNYREGIRIHSFSSWSDITLCGNDNTGDSGTTANSWFIGNNNGNFYITRNGSTSGNRLQCVNDVWSFRTDNSVDFLQANSGAAQNIRVGAIGCGSVYTNLDLANYRLHCDGKAKFTGQILTSFKNSVAMGSFGSSSATIPDLLNELRYSSGCMGSANITTAYSSIITGWYNFIWVPHRSGGANGAASGDNHNYGNLLLFGMTIDAANHFIVRYNSGSIQVRKI